MLGKFKNYIWFNILLWALAAVLGYAAWGMVRQALVLRKESSASFQKIEELSQRKQELEAALEELKLPSTIEREAKERLNLKKRGEEVVVVVPEEKESVKVEGKSWWEKFKRFLVSALYL